MKYLFCLILILSSCSNDIPYGGDTVYTFFSTSSESLYTDTLTMEYSDDSGFSSTVKWTAVFASDSGMKTIESERNISNTMLSLEIPSPIGIYLNDSELLPFPKVNIPPAIGDSIVSLHEVKYEGSPFIGQIVSGYLKIVGKVFYDNSLVNDSCWVLEANSNSHPDYSATYYFNEKYGFVFLEYSLSKNIIRVELEKVEKF